MHLDRTDVVQGREWLYGLGNTLQRSYLNNSITFEKYGRVFQIQGEHSVPNSPLICSMELESILQQPEEYEIYLCELIGDNFDAQIEKDEILLSTIEKLKVAFNDLLDEFKDIFPSDLPDELPPVREVDNKIEIIPRSTPICKPSYRLSQTEQNEVERQLTEYLRKGQI